MTNELKASCILEIVQKGQIASTLRPFEAVVYNRKLLTNNKCILSFSFYDPRFIQCFEDTSKIDWGWVVDGVLAEYEYKNDFSPLKLLENIDMTISDLESVNK